MSLEFGLRQLSLRARLLSSLLLILLGASKIGTQALRPLECV
jgi:hypothetical protein